MRPRVHVITANDYLVARDADTLRPLYTSLGLTVGAVTQSLERENRQHAYDADITYCTAKELVFDYLRTPRFSPFDLTTHNHSVMGFNLSFLFDKNEIMQQGMQQILHWLESGELQAPAVTSYPLEAVADAHRALESGQTTGKLVLRCTP